MCVYCYCSVHQGELGLPKTPWKYGIKNNSSDDAREQMSTFLKTHKHPLDMRRKEDGVRSEVRFVRARICAASGVIFVASRWSGGQKLCLVHFFVSPDTRGA